MGCRRKICFFAHTLEELRVSTVKAPDGISASEGINPFAQGPISRSNSNQQSFKVRLAR